MNWPLNRFYVGKKSKIFLQTNEEACSAKSYLRFVFEKGLAWPVKHCDPKQRILIIFLHVFFKILAV